MPTVPTSATPSSGPTKPPTLMPAAIAANSRVAWPDGIRSASTLHATEITSRLNTDSQT